ncbi:hypothetical protein GCM10020255_027950 [Rhodococcus baikonurensis]
MSNAHFITLHAIHAVPASLLNRDDSNAAKRINFGGTNRLRISSQAWKRAIRVNMRENAIEGGAYGVRTHRFPQLVAEQLVSAHSRELDVATAKAAAVFTALKLKATDKGTTAASIFASETLPTQLATAIDAHWDAITDDAPTEVIAAARAALDVDNTIDLALMGRMQAEIPVGGRIDGAVGVSHAFSVDPSPSKRTSSPPLTTQRPTVTPSQATSAPSISLRPSSIAPPPSTADSCAATSPPPSTVKNSPSLPKRPSSTGSSAPSHPPSSAPPSPRPCPPSSPPQQAPRSSPPQTRSPPPSFPMTSSPMPPRGSSKRSTVRSGSSPASTSSGSPSESPSSAVTADAHESTDAFIRAVAAA